MTSVVALTELLQLNVNGSPVSLDNPIPVAPENITGKFRESFENFVPGVNWNLVTGSGDIVQTDGNAVSASYLVISKDPLTAETETTLTYIDSFPMPAETAVGLSMSQRVLGQELSMELVSTETPLPPVADIAISSISQTTTTLTVNTTAAHGLVPGKRIGIKGCLDSRLNYPSLVVAATSNATQFLATAGPGGTIPSLSLSGGAAGFVYFRSALGYAQNGLSEIFENSATTNASVYIRSSAGDSLPSGTANANQSISCANTSSIQAIASPYTYAFLPTSEYRLNLQADRAQVYDVSVDSVSTTTSRQLRTQVIPDPTKQYTLRFRMSNVDALTVPTAKIVSVSKSGTTTATVTTAGPHGLTTSDQIVAYGVRDTVNFAAITAQVAVASVISSTQFTVVWGSAVTATSYGGMVSRVQGSNIPAQFNQGSNGSINSAQGFSGELQLIASNGFTSFVVGDYVNLYGLRDNSTGADLGLDGAYKVIDFSSNNARVIPIGSTPAVGTFGAISCGGLVIKRTDARIAFVRIFDYLRERVEVMPRPGGDASAAVTVTGAVSATVGAGASQIGSVIPVNQNTYSLQSSTNLAASATFTGTAQNIASATTSLTVYNTQLVIGVNHTAGLTPGQLYLDLGTETTSTAPTVFYQALAVAIPSNANWQQFSVPISTRYYRLRFVNGATAQTNFRLASYLTYNGGALSNPYSYPVNIQYALSTTALALNGVFTGVTLDYGDTMNIYQTITALAFSDQASATNGFKIQISRDGTNWRDAVSASVTANTLSVITVHLSYRYARVVYTNGAVAQTTFNLDAHVDAG
jgi:hypothetical protein